MPRTGMLAAALGMALLAGCSEELPTQLFAPMRSLCGEPAGPIRTLRIADDERIVSRTSRFGDRWIAEVDVYAGDAVDTASLSAWPDPEAHLVSVDGCGEDRQTLATKLLWARRDGSGEDAVWLGCEQDSRELLWIDPHGPSERRSLGPSGDPSDPLEAFLPTEAFSECGHWLRVGRDIWVERPTHGGLPSIAHLSVPQQGAAVEHEPLQARWIAGWTPQDGEPELIVRVGAEIQAVEPRTGDAQVLLEVDPLEEVSVAQGGFLRITDLATTAFRIVQWETGRDVQGEVGPGADGDADDGWQAAPGLLLRPHPSESVAVWLPELELQILPGLWQQPRRLEDGRAVLASGGASVDYYALDGPGAEPQRIATNLVRAYAATADGLTGLVPGDGETTDLVSFALDGSGPRVLAKNVNGPQAVIGGRWATLRDETPGGVAELLLADDDGTYLGRVDTDAAVRFGPTFAQEVGRFEPTEWLTWVVDTRGRRGLYYAELE